MRALNDDRRWTNDETRRTTAHGWLIYKLCTMSGLERQLSSVILSEAKNQFPHVHSWGGANLDRFSWRVILRFAQNDTGDWARQPVLRTLWLYDLTFHVSRFTLHAVFPEHPLMTTFLRRTLLNPGVYAAILLALVLVVVATRSGRLTTLPSARPPTGRCCRAFTTGRRLPRLPACRTPPTAGRVAMPPQ